MRHSIPYYLYILLTAIATLFIYNPPVHAEHYHYLYKQITLNAGLPSTLRCIYADTRGFVWTGTKSGLGRFNGHEQKRYIYKQGDPTSLPGNIIYQVLEDDRQNLWILTDRGIARYNYPSNNFTTLKNEKGEPVVAYSACTWKRRILFGGKNIVYAYDHDKGSIETLYRMSSEPEFDIAKLLVSEDETLFCCSRWEGIRAISLQTGACTPVFSKCGKEIADMLIDSEQRIWVAPYNQGLLCFNANGKEIASYTTSNSDISSNIVLCLIERKKHIWIGMDGGGIDILAPENNHFTHLKHIPGDKQYSLPTNSINALYCDNYDNIWMGGVYNGLINMREVSMKTYTDVLANSPWGLSNNIVISLYQDSPEEPIWIGTDGGGINSFNPHTEEFTHYPSTREDKITSICRFAPGKLLYSSFSEGIFIFDTATGKKTPFIVIDEQTTTTLCKHSYSVYLYRNTPNTLLLLGDHVYVYNLQDKTFTIASEEEEKVINWGTLQAIACNEKNTYLFDQKRIYELDNTALQLKVLLACDNGMTINSVTCDREGIFWIGSNYGLIRYAPQTTRLESVATPMFTEISSVVCGQQGEVWIGADNMLFSYQPKEKKFILYGESDGALPNEYVPRSQLVSGEKDIYIGGVKGLLHICDSWKMANVVGFPELQLSDVILNGESVGYESKKEEGAFSIPWNSNLAIQVMTKEEDIFRQKLYRYRIEGLDNRYTESFSSELTIRGLRSGHYKVLASCMTKDGSWTPEREILALTVLPAWYQSWWFVLGCAFSIAIVILWAFRRTLRRKERKLNRALQEHEHQMYEEKVRFLINISHELRTPLTLIYAPLKRILQTLSPEDNRYFPLKAIYRQSQRMKALINMVLDVRKMEVGETKLHIQPHQLNQWIEQVSQDFVKEGEAEHVHIGYQLDPRITEVSFDPNKCEIVLSNLLVNALKHSPQNTTITVTSEWIPDEGRVRISVSDEGCGLQAVNMQKLFTRFYQGDGEQSGTGIGLSYSKILVEQHGGTMGARNNHGAGATFFFELPLKQMEEEIICQPKAYLNELIGDDGLEIPSGSEDYDTSAYKILVVDDNPDMTDFLAKTLREYFKQVITASDGAEAIRLAQNHMPDIIISDVMMPGMNGYQLCKLIKEDIAISHIPIILLTARDDEQSQKEGYKNGADAYLTKPFEVDTLMELVRNRLKNRESVRKRYMDAGPAPIPEESTFSQADEVFLLRLNKIITDNLSNCHLDINYVCREIGMSRASLFNKLKALTNMGTNEYINKFRMERAIQLINTTDMTFVEIAEQVGFATSSYFSTAFKQYTNETPTQYKKRVRG